jgi:hypothetical protein
VNSDNRPGIYPDVPMFMVERDDLVKVIVENHTDSVHPTMATTRSC